MAQSTFYIIYINNNNVHTWLHMNTQRQSGRVAIKIDNIENKTNNFNQSEDSKNTKFIYFHVHLGKRSRSGKSPFWPQNIAVLQNSENVNF